MEVKYREFTLNDADQIKNLLVKFVEYLSSISTGRLSHPNPEYKEFYFHKILKIYNEGRGNIFVAEVNNKIVGFIQGEVKTQTEEELMEFKPIIEGYIRDIYVLDEYRVQGIGETLLKMMEQFLKNKGCTQYELFVLEANPSIEFYKKNGFKTEVLNLVKKL